MAETLCLVCQHCATVNRVPYARLEQSPKCGRCGKPLFAGQPFAVTEQNFQKHLEHGELPLVVDFWASWCGPCKMMEPVFQQAAQQMEPLVRFAKLDTEANPRLAGHFGIRSIPTVALFREGREVARQSGAMQLPQLSSWIRAQLR